MNQKTSYSRFPTRTVMIGDCSVGGRNPIRIQSMTTADTLNTDEVVRETLDLARAGCEIVRITAPGIKDAENLKAIKKALKKQGCTVPLVADIHFSPRAAMIAVEHVEKVRINPGNFTDKKKFDVREYTQKEYEEDLQKAGDAFIPLVRRAKELGRSIRIGVNHGSLSDRIMNRYGDTTSGMVESAIEFINMARGEGYHDLILSMKSSIPEVMVEAYKLLTERFLKENMNYPLHLGVTEAGEGRDGRIKSAIGIGSLLEDGLGDTIRVSLTEDSIYEIPVAKELARRYDTLTRETKDRPYHLKPFKPYEHNNRISLSDTDFPSSKTACGPVRLIGMLNNKDDLSGLIPLVEECDLLFYRGEEKINFDGVDAAIRKKLIPEYSIKSADTVETLLTEIKSESKKLSTAAFSIVFPKEALNNKNMYTLLAELIHTAENQNIKIIASCAFSKFSSVEDTAASLRKFSDLFTSPATAALSIQMKQSEFETSITEVYSIFKKILFEFNDVPVIIRGIFTDIEEAVVHGGIHAGGLLLNGTGEALFLESKNAQTADLMMLGADILQSARLRIHKTEFISCPSCGRTLFNLQETTRLIREKTGHLKGVKIAIMGCIVNGPGEMADADFGYVGAGPGKIHLYRGKDVVEKNVPSDTAVEKLIALIQNSGMWISP